MADVCKVCGNQFSNASYGGPGICPACDCGIPPKQKESFAQEMMRGSFMTLWQNYCSQKEEIEQLRGTLSLAEEGLANYEEENQRLRAALQDLADCCGHDDDKALLLALRNAAKALSETGAINGEPQERP